FQRFSTCNSELLSGPCCSPRLKPAVHIVRSRTILFLSAQRPGSAAARSAVSCMPLLDCTSEFTELVSQQGDLRSERQALQPMRWNAWRAVVCSSDLAAHRSRRVGVIAEVGGHENRGGVRALALPARRESVRITTSSFSA